MTEGFGVFQLASMQLALPLGALREVVPLGTLEPLPAPAGCVVGGLDLRGAIVPVLDITRLLDTDCTQRRRNVVIMAYGGGLLGLLADGVVGVFDCPPARMSRITTGDGSLSLLCGGFIRSDDGSVVSVLSPQAISALPGVPMAVEHDCAEGGMPTAQQTSQSPETEQTHYMLMQCGAIPLALPSEAVHTIIINPEVQPSAMSGGSCLGTIEFDALKVPALDLVRICGLGGDAAHPPGQAFVVKYPDGLVAFMVERIIDVVRPRDDTLVPLPPRALPNPALFAGMLPTAALGEVSSLQTASTLGYYLALSPQALLQSTELCGVARMNTPAASHGATQGLSLLPRGQAPRMPRARMLTYRLSANVEVATPIDQIAEILAWSPATAILGERSEAMALVMNRGRAIPTYSLAAQLGMPSSPPAEASCVLVIESGEAYVGFTVDRLTSIDEGQWPKPQAANTAGSGTHPALSLEPTLVGNGDEERLLTVIELKRLADTFCPTPTAVPSPALAQAG